MSEVEQLRAKIERAIHLDDDLSIDPRGWGERVLPVGYVNGWDDAIDEMRERIRAALNDD